MAGVALGPVWLAFRGRYAALRGLGRPRAVGEVTGTFAFEVDGSCVTEARDAAAIRTWS
jgi:hypothetical protein